jgi:hypothetical protein
MLAQKIKIKIKIKIKPATQQNNTFKLGRIRIYDQIIINNTNNEQYQVTG